MSKQKYPTTTGTSVAGVSRNVKQNGYSNFTLHAKRKFKRKDAEARQATYDKLSINQKLDQLGSTGSNRQRARLQTLLASVKTVVNVQNAVDALPKAKKKKANKS